MSAILSKLIPAKVSIDVPLSVPRTETASSTIDTTKFLPSTFDKVKQVIEILKTIDNGSCIDGETMDYIVKELGFEEYLLRSLVMKSSYKDTKDLLREKFELSI